MNNFDKNVFMNVTLSITQAWIDKHPYFKWLGFEANISYLVVTITDYADKYADDYVTMRQSGDHPPKPPKA